MLKKKTPKELDSKLLEAVDESRRMLMNSGYFVQDVFAIDEKTIDVIAVRETLLESERVRLRIVNPGAMGGLSLSTVKYFFSGQAKVFDVKGILISLTPIGRQVASYIDRKSLPVYGPEWLSARSDFDLNCDRRKSIFGL